MHIINVLFSVCVLYIKCVTYKDGAKTFLKSMKEPQSTFVARTVARYSLNSPFISIIFLLLVLKMSQARILVPEQQGRVFYFKVK